MSNRRGTRGRGNAQAAPVAAPVPIAPPVRFTTLNKDYNDLGGTQFKGSESIIEAQQWLEEAELIFARLNLNDVQKRQLGVWQLKEAAKDWWRTVVSPAEEENVTWDQFRNAFMTKWMPEAGKSSLYRAFMDLEQGNMTFAEYERKFNELSKYGPNLIDTPLKKNEKFIDGARPEYYSRLVNHVHGTFTGLVDMATRFENPTSKGKKAATPQHSLGPVKSPQKKKSNFEKQKKNWLLTKGIGFTSPRPAVDLSHITCFKCNQQGHYSNSCPYPAGTAIPPPAQPTRDYLCHVCLQPGHFKKDCPMQQKGKTSGVFAMTSSTPTTDDTQA